MKLQSLTENFKKGILIAEKIIGKNLTLPILSNILLEAENGRLKISATNLEIGVVCYIRAKVEKEGTVAIPGRILGSYLGSLLDGEKVDVELKDHTITLKSKGSKASIKGVDAKDFPIIPKINTDSLLEIDSQVFQESVVKVVSSAATTETRQELTGIYFGFEKDKVVLAATDSFRLAESIIELGKENLGTNYQNFIAKNQAIIIPSRTLQEVARSITPESGKVKIFMGESQIFFEVDEIVFVSRLIDGKYPEYKQVIPKNFTSSVYVKREDLLKAVRTASIFSDSKSREVKLRVSSGEKSVKIESQSVETGENVTEVAARVEIKGESSIAFNNRYLVDALNVLMGEEIYIGFNDNFGPVIFRETDGKGAIKEKYLHIVMPIRS